MTNRGSIEERVQAFLHLRGVTMTADRALRMFQERESLEDASQLLCRRGLDATLAWNAQGEDLSLSVWLETGYWTFEYVEGELSVTGILFSAPSIAVGLERFHGVTGADGAERVAGVIQEYIAGNPFEGFV